MIDRTNSPKTEARPHWRKGRWQATPEREGGYAICHHTDRERATVGHIGNVFAECDADLVGVAPEMYRALENYREVLIHINCPGIAADIERLLARARGESATKGEPSWES